MMHPDTEIRFINEQIGSGIFARKFIPAGTITYVIDELENFFDEAAYNKLSPKFREIVEKYSTIDQFGIRMISWDIAKYVNHSCDPNSISTGYGFEIAIRDIQAGEEVTDEYGIFNWETEMKLYGCGGDKCRRYLRKTDFDNFYPEWDEKIKPAMEKLFSVKQPLLDYMDKETLLQIEEYKKDKSTYKSVYNLKFKG